MVKKENQIENDNLKIKGFNESVNKDIDTFRENLEDFLNELESLEDDAEFLQEIDLNVQNWKFFLELQKNNDSNVN